VRRPRPIERVARKNKKSPTRVNRSGRLFFLFGNTLFPTPLQRFR
jgi:hypothetical protein